MDPNIKKIFDKLIKMDQKGARKAVHQLTEEEKRILRNVDAETYYNSYYTNNQDLLRLCRNELEFITIRDAQLKVKKMEALERVSNAIKKSLRSTPNRPQVTPPAGPSNRPPTIRRIPAAIDLPLSPIRQELDLNPVDVGFADVGFGDGGFGDDGNNNAEIIHLFGLGVGTANPVQTLQNHFRSLAYGEIQRLDPQPSLNRPFPADPPVNINQEQEQPFQLPPIPEERELVEQQSVAPQPVEQQPVEQQPVETPQPVEQQPVEQQPVATPQPVEQQPVEQQPVEQQPVPPEPAQLPVVVPAPDGPNGRRIYRRRRRRQNWMPEHIPPYIDVDQPIRNRSFYLYVEEFTAMLPPSLHNLIAEIAARTDTRTKPRMSSPEISSPPRSPTPPNEEPNPSVIPPESGSSNQDAAPAEPVNVPEPVPGPSGASYAADAVHGGDQVSAIPVPLKDPKPSTSGSTKYDEPSLMDQYKEVVFFIHIQNLLVKSPNKRIGIGQLNNYRQLTAAERLHFLLILKAREMIDLITNARNEIKAIVFIENRRPLVTK